VPPPLDADFFEIAGQTKGHGTPKLTRKVLEDVWTLYGKVSGIGLENYYRDIETRGKYQYAHTHDSLNFPKQNATVPRDSIKTVSGSSPTLPEAIPFGFSAASH
jgi:hypothetical protein